MDEDLVVASRAVDSSLVVKVGGEVDAVSASCFLQALDCAVLGTGICQSVQLDLSDVTFFSAAGVNALVKAYKEASLRSLDLRVIAASRQVERVMKLTGVDYLLGRPRPDSARS